METSITTLVENRPGAHRSMIHEHGISFYIEHRGNTLLFDTGQSDALLENAAIVRADLGAVDHVVLSHSHYDHTNGVPFLAAAGYSTFTLHVHAAFFHRKFSTDGISTTYIGPSWDEAWCADGGIEIDRVDGTGTELLPGLHIVTGFDRTHPEEVNNPRFVVERPGSEALEVDDFRDEVSIVLETARGLVVLVGCSHPGIMNMLDTVRSRFSDPIFAVLGGTHLVEAAGARLDTAITYLQSDAVGRLGLSHCTGDEAMDRLSSSDRFFRNVTGATLTV